MKLKLKNIVIIIAINILLVVSVYGQSTQSSAVNISIKIVKNSYENKTDQNSFLNEVFLNAGDFNNLNKTPRDLIINFSDYSTNTVDDESIMLEREMKFEKIKINFNKQICIRNVAKNEKIRIIPTKFNSTLAQHKKSTLTIAY